jgi:hypothetical protein
MKYVYITSEPGLYTVGFYDPAGKWEPESDHSSTQEAAGRVHYLNGGDAETDAPGDQDKLDVFAAAALSGYLASFSFDDVTQPDFADAASMAFRYAAAMIVERSKREGR